MLLRKLELKKPRKVCHSKQNFGNPQTGVLDVKFCSPRPMLGQQIKSRIANASSVCHECKSWPSLWRINWFRLCHKRISNASWPRRRRSQISTQSCTRKFREHMKWQPHHANSWAGYTLTYYITWNRGGTGWLTAATLMATNRLNRARLWRYSTDWLCLYIICAWTWGGRAC